jgi:hypothetical protein
VGWLYLGQDISVRDLAGCIKFRIRGVRLWAGSI